MGEMNITKLLQVTRAVEREVKGGNGSGFHCEPRFGYNPAHNGSAGRKTGSDWVMIRGEMLGRMGVLRVEKQNGLCFKCGGPFHHMHQCPKKQLRVLVVEKDDDDEDETKFLDIEVDEGDEEEKVEMSVLNLHHIAHKTHHTMKFQGAIHGIEVLILVDSGATHNFIS
ncbi:hypothetical protein KIW84_076183 [Lathyrus oleraceus]|uniref:Uncharacterized protein n=1 Tax=Pisum sativum TaxID=3888 RepID=A0A9D4VX20_PEA|nr:hypothetical protein KIW84_076183 [Pisum sativum]